MRVIGVRKELDNLGRLVIPKLMRDSAGIKKDVELILTDNGILIKNPESSLTVDEKGEDKSSPID